MWLWQNIPHENLQMAGKVQVLNPSVSLFKLLPAPEVKIERGMWRCRHNSPRR
jgi:hypothetical protein